jgi:sulfonate transport system substrate-binding protein
MSSPSAFRFVPAFLLALGVATAACPAVAAQDPEPDLSGVTLRVGIFEDVTHDAVAATDFLKNTPYKITWARLNGAGPTVQALGGDAIDLSWGLSDTAAPKASSEDRQNWTADNAPIKIVALMKAVNGRDFSPSLIIANKDSGVKTLADLRGKTYAYNEGGNANAIALLALDKAGLTLKDVQIRLLTYDATAPAVVAGAVAAAPATRARIADALSDGTVRQIATDTGSGFQVSFRLQRARLQSRTPEKALPSATSCIASRTICPGRRRIPKRLPSPM